MAPDAEVSFYLMKAEPDSRVVKGKDVKFSVDDFEMEKTASWEGVRNYEARNIMREMKLGDKVLFYHSNTKDPGIAAFAEVSKEAYPDHTAWDETHPYFDGKSDASSPKWFMVDLRFLSRVGHFVPLALLRHLSALSEVPMEMSYLTVDDIKAIKNMALLNKGRLSVQRVERVAWAAISKIAEKGYDGIDLKRPKSRGREARGNVGKRMANLRSQNKVPEDGTDDLDAGMEEEADGKRKAMQEREGTAKRTKRVKT